MPDSREAQLRIAIKAVNQGLISESTLLSAIKEWVVDDNRSLPDVLLSDEAVSNESKMAIVQLFQKTYVESDKPTPALSPSPVTNEQVDRVRQLLREPKDEELVDDPSDEYGRPTQQFTPTHETRSSQTRVQQPVDESNRFEVGKLIGKGGLGEVYSAEDLQLRRTVALKQIRHSKQTDADLAREKFFLEAEVTGNLEHPGIVPVYSFGINRHGEPFFAMRLIHGDNFLVAIREFHQKNKSTSAPFDGIELRKLLRKFLDVCNAIEYAHVRGVLHRDLKPANIMVGKHGETLVVDWGLAKVLQSSVETRDSSEKGDGDQPIVLRHAADIAQTRLGSFIGTPAYSSPEQLIGMIDEVDARSDIFSLGAVLYELLCGQSSCSSAGSRLEIYNRIRDGLIPSPRTVNKLVPKPLDAICRKAMAFDKKDRYIHAIDLANDVERWMADERVLAYDGHEPLVEHAGRFIRRNRSWVLAIGTALLLVTGLAIVATYFVNDARLGEKQAKQSAEEFKSDAIARFKIARDALDTLTEKSDDLRNSPATTDVQQRLLEKAADLYATLSRQESADFELEMERIRAIVRSGDIAHLQNKTALAHEQYQLAIAMLKSDAFAQGKSNGQTASGIEYGRQLELARVHSRIGLAMDNEGKSQEAVTQFDSAIEIYQALDNDGQYPGVLEGNLAVALSNKGSLFERASSFAEAAKLLEQSVQLFNVSIPNDAKRWALPAARTMESLGRVLHKLGRIEDSNRLFSDAKSTLNLVVEPDSKNSEYSEAQASLHVSLANLERSHGDVEKASAELLQAHDIYKQLSMNWPDSLIYRENSSLVAADMGLVAMDREDFESAASQFELAERGLRYLADGYPTFLRYQFELATLYDGLGQVLTEIEPNPSPVEELFEAALRTWNLPSSDGTPVVGTDGLEQAATTASHLGRLLHTHGKRNEARIKFEQSLAILETLSKGKEILPEMHYRMGFVYWNSGLLEWDDQHQDAAREHFTKCKEHWNAAESAEHSPRYRNQIAKFLLHCPDKTLRDLTKANQLAQQSYTQVPTHRGFAVVYAESLVQRGDTAASQKVLDGIKERHGSWNAFDLIVQSQIHRKNQKVLLAEQAIEDAKRWMSQHRPLSLELQRLINASSE